MVALAQAREKRRSHTISLEHFQPRRIADVYAVVDLPDSAAAAALSLTITGGGVASVRTVALLTPEEVDRAARMHPDYSPGPG